MGHQLIVFLRVDGGPCCTWLLAFLDDLVYDGRVFR